MSTTWKKLTRTDISHFDKDAKRIVLTAMRLGGTGRIGNQGHALIRAADNDETMSVSRKSSVPNRLENMQKDLRRLFPQSDLTTADESTATMNHTLSTSDPDSTNVLTTNENGVVVTATGDEQMIPCPAKGCDKEFVTEGAKLAHIRNYHFTCGWVGADVDHDDPNYRCDHGTDGTAFIGLTKNAVGGHTNVKHLGSRPWEHRDPAKRSASAQKGAATRAANAAKAAGRTVKAATPKLVDVHDNPAVVAPNVERVATERSEHRGLPTGDVKHKPLTDAAKLQAIRELLGQDPKVAFLEAANAKLQAKIDELEAQLALVAEVLHLATPVKKNS